MEPLVIDGSQGEGGGQILRSSLSLSMVTGRPVVIQNIRAGRSKPGLRRQHLTCVRAAQSVSDAIVEGDQLGSSQVRFTPQVIEGGRYEFAVGTAGSTTLVLQTVLPALWRARQPSEVSISGGTHNVWAPPVHFVQRSFAPAVQRMGFEVDVTLDAWGFVPAGRGRLTARVTPCDELRPLHLDVRGEIIRRSAVAVTANLPSRVAHRELKQLAERLGLAKEARGAMDVQSAGPGNVVWVEVQTDAGVALFADFGRKRKTAEAVANTVADMVQTWIASDTAVEPHLADQLLLPMAMVGSGSFITPDPTEHTRTNMLVIERFLPVKFSTTSLGEGRWRIAVQS